MPNCISKLILILLVVFVVSLDFVRPQNVTGANDPFWMLRKGFVTLIGTDRDEVLRRYGQPTGTSDMSSLYYAAQRGQAMYPHCLRWNYDFPGGFQPLQFSSTIFLFCDSNRRKVTLVQAACRAFDIRYPCPSIRTITLSQGVDPLRYSTTIWLFDPLTKEPEGCEGASDGFNVVFKTSPKVLHRISGSSSPTQAFAATNAFNPKTGQYETTCPFRFVRDWTDKQFSAWTVVALP